MKAGWKLIFPILAIGLPVGILGGIILSKKIAANREERAIYDRARAAGMLLTMADLKAIAPADVDNVMVPLHQVWSRKQAFIKSMDTAPYKSWAQKDVDDIIAAAREAVKRKEAFDLPSIDRLMFSDDWYTMFVLKQCLAGEAPRNPAKARECFELMLALSRKLAESKDAQYTRSGLREYSTLDTQALLATYYAKSRVGDVLQLSQNSPLHQPDLELAKVECAKLLVLLDLLADGHWKSAAQAPVTPEESIALRDTAALQKTKSLLIAAFTALTDPKRLEKVRKEQTLQSVIQPHKEDPRVALILEVALNNEDFTEVITWSRGRHVPEDILPWYIKTCEAGGKSPAGLAGAKDRFGRPILFKSYSGGMMVYTCGQDGKEDDPKKWKDDRWIRVETPKVGTRTLRTRVTLRD